MQLDELEIEAIITKACGKYQTGDNYTFEDVWNCIESALAAHSAGAQTKPVAFVGWGGEGKPKTLLLLREENLPVGTPLYAKCHE